VIHAVRANRPTFNVVEFAPGFNVVLADRTRESTRKDSRNGLGKSTLVEIVHFCLGASTRPGKGLRVEALCGWTFSPELDLGSRHLVVHRSVDRPMEVELEGDTEGWPAERRGGGRIVLHEKSWTSILGAEMFGLSPMEEQDRWSPTFRSLLGYFVRRGRDAFSTPFEHHRKQQVWDKQVNTAFLLGLAWEDAQAWQRLRVQDDVVRALKRGARAGVVEGLLGTVGELEAEKVQLAEDVHRREAHLRSFKVHPEYREIEQRASDLTRQIHDLSNANVADRRLLDFYRSAIEEVDQPQPDDVQQVYEEAGVALPHAVVRRLEQVLEFHRCLVENRRHFLAGEVDRVGEAILDRERCIGSLSEERARLLEVLRDHGALEEHSRLQELHVDAVTRLGDLRNRLKSLKDFEKGRSTLKIERERLHQRALQDYEDRRSLRERAISFFNAHSQALYEAPGRLVLDVADRGFRFNVEIERAGSQGIESMKVLCYDLMLAQLWARQAPSPGFLVHDSTVFDGVDERQVAGALRRAAAVSATEGFQYICTMNSDGIPTDELPPDFDLDSYVRLRLTDASPAGSLLGIRF